MIQQIPQPVQGRSMWRTPTNWLIAAIVVLGAAIVGFLGREGLAKRRVDDCLAELRKQGLPTDDTSMEHYFVSSTSKENTVAWNNFANLATGWVSQMSTYFPHSAGNVLPREAYLGGDWPEGTRVGELLAEIEPAMQEIHRVADNTHGPVWQPIQFNGYLTSLGHAQESRSIGRLILLDYEYSVFIKDKQRAIRDLKTAMAAVRAYRWNAFLVSDLVNLAQIGMIQSSVGQTLDSPMWKAEDLVELRKIIDIPIDGPERWEKVWPSELAAALSSLKNLSLSGFQQEESVTGIVLTWTASLPSSQLRFINEMSALLALGNVDQTQILAEADRLTKEQNLGLLSMRFIPSATSVARAYINIEEQRRLVVTAIALKQFKLAHGSYPARLDAVLGEPALGISRADIEGLDRCLLGFAMQKDGSVIIWNSRGQDGAYNKIDAEVPAYDRNSGYVQRSYGHVIELN